jgi:uncharacterized protein (DUF433 family)
MNKMRKNYHCFEMISLILHKELLVLYNDYMENRLDRITVDSDICGGRPCVRGLRIRVTDILSLLSSGASIEEILADYPSLEKEDILAATEYAARQTDHRVLKSA